MSLLLLFAAQTRAAQHYPLAGSKQGYPLASTKQSYPLGAS